MPYLMLEIIYQYNHFTFVILVDNNFVVQVGHTTKNLPCVVFIFLSLSMTSP